MGRPSRFKFIAGHTALDFMNTVAWRLSESPEDQIDSFDSLAEWAYRAGLIDRAEAAVLERATKRFPRRAARVLRLALDLREQGYELVEALIEHRRPRPGALVKLNQLGGRREYRAIVRLGPDGYLWAPGGHPGDPERLLYHIVRSFMEFFPSPESRFVARCHDDRGCGWVFLDRSPGRRRQWCSMADCGNRAKVRSHYRRRTAG